MPKRRTPTSSSKGDGIDRRDFLQGTAVAVAGAAAAGALPTLAQAAAVLAQLGEPGPDLFDGRVDRDGTRLLRDGGGNDLVAGKRHRQFGGGGAPVEQPGAENEREGGRERGEGDDDRRATHQPMRAAQRAVGGAPQAVHARRRRRQVEGLFAHA